MLFVVVCIVLVSHLHYPPSGLIVASAKMEVPEVGIPERGMRNPCADHGCKYIALTNFFFKNA